MGSVVKSAGKMLGIGSGNTPSFNAGRYNYKMDKNAFGPTNADIVSDLRVNQGDIQDSVAGIDQREGRAQQTALAQALEAQSRGEGPSIAQNQLREGTERNLAQQMALAASARGGNAATTQRQVMQNQAAANQQMAGQAADLRAQEMLAAQNQLGQLSTQMREQDAAAQNNAFSQEGNVLSEIQAIRDANRASAVNYETTRMNQGLGIGNQALQDTMARREGRNSIIGGLIQGAASGAATAASDERLKEDITDGSSDTQKFLDALKAKKFEYKRPDKYGEGERVGVMAQDVESGGPLGKSIVSDTPEGKMLDIPKGFGAVLAAQSELNERLKKLEAKKEQKRG